jgi:hypothetical protein
MGAHEEPQIEMYWNTDFNKGPLHYISNHISLHRFEQIKRYCPISCLESDERNGFGTQNPEFGVCYCRSGGRVQSGGGGCCWNSCTMKLRRSF